MFYFLYGLHLLVVFSWAIFLLQFIKSLENNLSDKYIFGILSVIMMLIVLGVGTKLMLLNPVVAKSGAWLHVKLSFDILLMIENVYLLYILFKNKTLSDKVYEILYWGSYLCFILMIALTMFRPF
jgi:putative membrane protein